MKCYGLIAGWEKYKEAAEGHLEDIEQSMKNIKGISADVTTCLLMCHRCPRIRPLLALKIEKDVIQPLEVKQKLLEQCNAEGKGEKVINMQRRRPD